MHKSYIFLLGNIKIHELNFIGIKIGILGLQHLTIKCCNKTGFFLLG